MQTEYKQGAPLVAKLAFAFKAPGARGRAVQVQPGQRFWVTNCGTDQRRSGHIVIDREGRDTARTALAAMAARAERAEQTVNAMADRFEGLVSRVTKAEAALRQANAA